jgi:hypothetical protein
MALRSNESEQRHGYRLRRPTQDRRRVSCRIAGGPSGVPGGGAQTAVIDVDENDTAEGIDLPGADLSGEELTVIVVPEQSDEFTCSSCFLVRHRSQVAREKNGMKYCRDCEG